LAPRHPPSALCSLTTTATHQAVSCRVARDAPCTQLGEIEDLQSAETYPVVKVRPCGSTGSLRSRLQRSAGRWVSSHGSEERCRCRHKTAARSAEPPYQQRLRSSSLGLCAPVFSLSQVPSEAVVYPPGSSRGGGDEETRTPDPLLAKEMLCQLSYVPRRQPEWWATLDSNQ
jgi:hypothetical protein